MSIDGYLTFEDGEVWLNDVLLPGILRRMTIGGAVRYDQSHSDYMSGKKKIAKGWEDASIMLTMDLLCDKEGTCYDKLQEINHIFKDSEKGKATPKIYYVTGSHFYARRIDKVVFDSLESTESDCEDVIEATLCFSEHLPAVVKREIQANAKKKAAAPAAPAVKPAPAKAPAIVSDTTNPFIAGFNAGNN